MTKLSNGWMTFTDLMLQRPSGDTKAASSEAPPKEPVQSTQQQESPQVQTGQVEGLSAETPSDQEVPMESPSPSTPIEPSLPTTEPPKSQPNES